MENLTSLISTVITSYGIELGLLIIGEIYGWFWNLQFKPERQLFFLVVFTILLGFGFLDQEYVRYAVIILFVCWSYDDYGLNKFH